jgi:DNA-directed RNA polymerase omega subunit
MATPTEAVENEVETTGGPEVDSKYRLIILAAKRSKQLQRGAQPRIEIDPQKHKPTRIALEEVIRGRVHFNIKENDPEVAD